MTQNPALRTKGAGNALWVCQIDLNSTSDGFTAHTGTDVFGATAATWHNVGTISKSPLDRQSDGSHKCVLSVLEDDDTRRKFILNAAPASAAQITKDPDYTAEDGTQIVVSSNGSSLNPNLPIFVIAKREATLPGAENSFFVAVVQFDPATKRPNDPKSWNEKDITFVSIDALDYAPTLPTDTMFGSTTTADLTGNGKFGTFITVAA
jgi:hypothetical protein